MKNLKRISIVLISFFMLTEPIFSASPSRKGLTNSKKKAATSAKKSTPKKSSTAAKRNTVKPQSSAEQNLAQALRLARDGQYQSASAQLFSLSRRSELRDERMQIKYILGMMLSELKLNQVAAFQFVDVIRTGDRKYTKQSLEKLSVVADNLGDDTLLNYAISKVNVSEFPQSQKDMLLFRLGEVKQKVGQTEEATELFSKVSPSSRYYGQAKFNEGLAQLESSDPDAAIKTYRELYNSKKSASVTDPTRVAATMALARSYYQKGDWDNAIEYYRQVPRDTESWHDALFESSWAMLRSGKFRSSLSNFQSLHSNFYEDTYQAESMLLRAIVYLYICKYDEMEKVLGLFERIYGPVRSQISDFVKWNDPMVFFNEVEKIEKALRNKKVEDPSKLASRLPFGITKSILKEGDVSRSFNYLNRLHDEKRRIETMGAWSTSPVGKYSLKIVNNRIKNTKSAIGEMIKNHLIRMKSDLTDLYEQAGFIRYEMINGQKEQLKKRIADKSISEEQIDEKLDRKFYVQNGYEYWPFQGEFWIDEIGNYQYLGKQSCE